MAKEPLKNQDIAELLSKLRDETPEYSPELMKSRKTRFLERMDDIKASAGDQSGSDRYTGGSNSLDPGGPPCPRVAAPMPLIFCV